MRAVQLAGRLAETAGGTDLERGRRPCGCKPPSLRDGLTPVHGAYIFTARISAEIANFSLLVEGLCREYAVAWFV